MKTYLLLLSIFFLAISSCKEDEPSIIACGETDPVENVSWIEIEIQALEQVDDDLLQYFYVSQAQYKGEIIFIFADCCPYCNTVQTAYNCEGELIGTLGCNADQINFSILENDVVIWKPKNFSCSEGDRFTC